MASVDFHQKISGHEAKEWIRNCCDAVNGGATYGDEEEFIKFISEHKPKDFKAPRKSRASKKSSEERAETEYNCELCDARVWNSGLGGQCSRKKIEGEWCCTIHHKEAAKNDGCLRNGLVTEERPTHAYGDEAQQMLPWHDVEIPKKTKKTSEGKGKGTRKCSNCGECGHNKKTCPHLKCEKVEEKVVEQEPEQEPEPVQEQEQEPEPEQEPEQEQEVEKIEDVISTVRAALTEVVSAVVVSSTSVKDDGCGVGFNLEESIVPVGKKGETKQTDEVVSPKTEPLSDEVLEEDESGDTITFQGVEYTFDTEENMVYDDELAEVGTWDGENIEFINATAAKCHRVRKLTRKMD
tara:strand:+ start:210 stop:1262 length:1053 start_codon:yes stop_codon:yes gene_type:complete